LSSPSPSSLAPNRIQNGDILLPAKPGPPGKRPLNRTDIYHANVHVELVNLLSSNMFSGVKMIRTCWRMGQGPPCWTKGKSRGRDKEGRTEERMKERRDEGWERGRGGEGKKNVVVVVVVGYE